jgi:hypothetical protein
MIPSWISTSPWSTIIPIVVSILALIVSLFSAVNNYYFSKNSIKPMLSISIGESQSNINTFGMSIKNSGMGPAKIESISFLFEGESYNEVRKFHKYFIGRLFPGIPIEFEYRITPIAQGFVIGAGQEVMITNYLKKDESNQNKIESSLNRVDVRITYSSVGDHKYDFKHSIKS